MAHELTQRKNGFIEFAALGERKNVWHKLGQYLEEGASIETWKEQAGMEWMVNSSPLMYSGKADIIVDDSKQILHRSDTEELLGIVSKDYKIVHPGEVLEFFRDLTEQNQMKLSAAGTLFGGKRFWATAEMGKSAHIVDGDRIDGFLLLTSSADGSASTTAKFVSTRVVCNNTLQIAMNEKARNAIKITHASTFDPKEVKIDLGLLDVAWDSFIGNLKTLASKKVSDDLAQQFFAKLITPDNSAIDMELLKTQRHVDALMHFYRSGAGAEFSYGTQYGLLNAATELWTHGTGKTDASKQFESSEFKDGSKMKTLAMNRLLALV
jgi:phage/plasmid-like protein (TIGR03299 family)